MIDADLAEMYQVPTKRLNEQVKRNIERFPADFMFQLTAEEFGNLRSQIATSSTVIGNWSQIATSSERQPDAQGMAANSSQFAMSSGSARRQTLPR